MLSRDQGDPDGPLVGGRISRKYRRIADHLEIVGIEDAGGRGQTLRTTDEHPFFVTEKGWTKSRLLEAGDALAGPAEVCSIVTANARQSHPEGVVVYKMEIEGSHTYFVRGDQAWSRRCVPAAGRWDGGNAGIGAGVYILVRGTFAAPFVRPAYGGRDRLWNRASSTAKALHSGRAGGLK